MVMLVGGKPAIGTIEYVRAQRGDITVRTDHDGENITKEAEVYVPPAGPRTSSVPGRGVIVEEVQDLTGSQEELDSSDTVNALELTD